MTLLALAWTSSCVFAHETLNGARFGNVVDLGPPIVISIPRLHAYTDHHVGAQVRGSGTSVPLSRHPSLLQDISLYNSASLLPVIL